MESRACGWVWRPFFHRLPRSSLILFTLSLVLWSTFVSSHYTPLTSLDLNARLILFPAAMSPLPHELFLWPSATCYGHPDWHQCCSWTMWHRRPEFTPPIPCLPPCRSTHLSRSGGEEPWLEMDDVLPVFDRFAWVERVIFISSPWTCETIHQIVSIKSRGTSLKPWTCLKCLLPLGSCAFGCGIKC